VAKNRRFGKIPRWVCETSKPIGQNGLTRNSPDPCRIQIPAFRPKMSRVQPLSRTLAPIFLSAACALGVLSAQPGEARAEGSQAGSPTPTAHALPTYDHIVIIFEENKNYEQIMGNVAAAYINSVLLPNAAVFTKMYGEEHFSEGNYFWLLSGSNHGIGFRDGIPSAKNTRQYPIVAPNLAEQLIGKGRSFKGYSENLPAVGSDVDFFPLKGAPLYARKHVPWVSFGNIPPTSNVPFTDFPTDPTKFTDLPTVSIVIPNLEHDMHNGRPVQSVPVGDQWIKENLDAYYQWAKMNNSLLIVTFDENDDKEGYQGLTNPGVNPKEGPEQEFRRDLQNRIPTIFAGAHIKAGEYPEGAGITHVNILRTLETMYGLKHCGAQQGNAAGMGIKDDYIITDVFK
jgi:phosphatidylinositol-3-phosphatase